MANSAATKKAFAATSRTTRMIRSNTKGAMESNDTPWKWRKNRLSGTEAITKIVQNCQESLGMIVRMDNWSSTLNLCLMEVLAMANDPLTRSGQTKSPYSCFLFP